MHIPVLRSCVVTSPGDLHKLSKTEEKLQPRTHYCMHMAVLDVFPIRPPARYRIPAAPVTCLPLVKYPPSCTGTADSAARAVNLLGEAEHKEVGTSSRSFPYSHGTAGRTLKKEDARERAARPRPPSTPRGSATSLHSRSVLTARGRRRAESAANTTCIQSLLRITSPL